MATYNRLSEWDKYFGYGHLTDWQRLCGDLGLPNNLGSKTQCSRVSITHFQSVSYLAGKHNDLSSIGLVGSLCQYRTIPRGSL
jgi:hypothetical protein